MRVAPVLVSGEVEYARPGVRPNYLVSRRAMLSGTAFSPVDHKMWGTGRGQYQMLLGRRRILSQST